MVTDEIEDEIIRVGILAVGDELLCGEIVDTNTPHIAGRLFDKGFKVLQTRTVGDDELAICDALFELARANEAVIVTGGLGPTEDDVTAAAAARVTGASLAERPEALAHLEAFAKRVNRELHPENRRQALLPEQAEIFDNPLGTACGFRLFLLAATIYFLPGVPSEMERMVEESVLPGLIHDFGDQGGWSRRTLKLFGLPEAQAGALIKEIPLPPEVQLAYCVRFPEVHIILRAPTGREADLEKGKELVKEKVASYLFAEDNESIDSVVASLFRATNATLSLAESCTGGMIAARITSLSGSSAYFLEGGVTYSNAAKSRVLGVPHPLIAEKGAVSAEVACAMAQGVREASGSTLALSVTGIAGPEGGSADKPVGTVFIALADQSRCSAKRYHFAGDRERVRLLTTYTALDLLRRHLLTLPRR